MSGFLLFVGSAAYDTGVYILQHVGHTARDTFISRMGGPWRARAFGRNSETVGLGPCNKNHEYNLGPALKKGTRVWVCMYI